MTLASFLRRLCCCCCCTAVEPAADTDERIEAETELTAPSKQQRRRTEEQSNSPDSDGSSSNSGGGGGHVAIDIRAARSPNGSASPAVSYAVDELGLTPSQATRALELSRWSSLDLGWRVLADPALMASGQRPRPGQRTHFFFNVWTARTVWEPPPAGSAARGGRTLQNQTSDLAIPGHMHWIEDCRKWLKEELGITLLLWPETRPNSSRHRRASNAEVARVQRLLCGFDIQGRPPGLLHLFFYAHVLRRELGLYPRAFLHSYGLRYVLLADGLRLGDQARMAIPLLRSGTLVLDPRLEEICYVTNVLHHEFWHMIDVGLIWRATEAARLRQMEKDNYRRADEHIAVNRGSHADGANGAGVAPMLFDDDEDWSEEEERPFDFTTPLPASLRGPLADSALVEAVRLHSVPDVLWARLNAPGFFGYGEGGHRNRGKNLFLSSSAGTGSPSSPPGGGTGGLAPGFLNGYSQTAVEEDKAEVFAALMRHSDATSFLSDNDGSDGEAVATVAEAGTGDTILRAKARELRRRLEWGSDSIDASFWMRVQQHTPHPARAALSSSPPLPSLSANAPSSSPQNAVTAAPTTTATSAVAGAPASADWKAMRTHEGHEYYFNTTTKQTSWIKPAHMNNKTNIAAAAATATTNATLSRTAAV